MTDSTAGGVKAALNRATVGDVDGEAERDLAVSKEVSMTVVKRLLRTFLGLAIVVGIGMGTRVLAQDRTAPHSAAPITITILYDAFGKPSDMQKDWGYSALIEYAGKRILFDAGNNPDILARNVKAKGIDLSRLDFVVMSHRHGDHMGGLAHVLSVNPSVTIYAPKEAFGVFGGDLPGTFYRRDMSLQPEQQYFDGAAPALLKFGSAWPGANFHLIDKDTEIAAGVHLVTLISDKPGTLELREVSLALDTPDGMVIVVGCSHPGIEKIVGAATRINPHIRLIAGGFHLVTSSDADIAAVVTALHDQFHVDEIAPGHCTGEPAFAALKKAFGTRFLYAGLGTAIQGRNDPTSPKHF